MTQQLPVRNVFTASFTDAYGVTHTEAQCFVSSISRSDNVHFDDAGNASVSANCNYSVRYWHDQTAKDEGKRLMDFVIKEGSSQLYLQASVNLSLQEVIAEAEKDFMAKIETMK